MRLSSRARGGLLALLASLAIANLLDDFPATPPADWSIEPLSSLDRGLRATASRERGSPALRRGRLTLPDLFAFTLSTGHEAPLPSRQQLRAEFRIPQGSWVDIVVGTAPELTERGVIRLSTVPEESWVATVSLDRFEAPVETPLRFDPRCLAPPERILLDVEAGEATLRLGDCPALHFAIASGPGIGLRSGLAGLGVESLAIELGEGSERRIARRGAFERMPSCALPALVLVGSFILLRRLLRRLRGPGRHPPLDDRRFGAICLALTMASLPITTWPYALCLLASAVLVAWCDGAPPPDEHSRRIGTVLACSILVLGALFSLAGRRADAPVPAPGGTVLEPTAPVEAPVDEGGIATLADVAIDLRGDGVALVLLDAPTVAEGVAVAPTVFPELLEPATGILLRRSDDVLDWYLLFGDLVLRSGRTEPGRLQTTRASGHLTLWREGVALAKTGGLAPRPGRVRVLSLEGQPDFRVHVTRAPISRGWEVASAVLPSMGVLALVGLLLSRLGMRWTALGGMARAIAYRPAALLALAGLTSLASAKLEILMLGWWFLPLVVTISSVAIALRAMTRIPRIGPPAALRALVALALPHWILSVGGAGPASVRWTTPWYGNALSSDVLPVMDPEMRLFNDTALTGRYRFATVEKNGAPRVIALGGSQTFGEGFDGGRPPEIWTTGLPGILPDLDAGAEVVNLAVQGGGLATQRMRLAQFVETHGPVDGIVAVFGVNDGSLLRSSRTRWEAIDSVVARRSSAWRVDPCAHLASCSIPRFFLRAIPFMAGRANGTPEELHRTLAGAIEGVVDLASQGSAWLVLAAEPQACDLVSCTEHLAPYDYPNGFDWMASRLGELDHLPGVTVIDPRPCLRSHRARLPFSDAAHFTENGHRTMLGCLEGATGGSLNPRVARPPDRADPAAPGTADAPRS